MANPFVFELKTVTNDVISSKEIKPNLEGQNSKGIDYNGYRVDEIELIIGSMAALVTGDYFIIELGYDDLNGGALANLKELNDKQHIERVMIGPFEVLGTNGNTAIKPDPAKKPFIFKFRHGYCLGENFWINVLFHGLASTRDCQFILYGNPVGLKKFSYDANNTKTKI